MGRAIEERNAIAPNASIQIGAMYKPGVYYMQILQGNTVKTYKLLKTGK
jgi:hypothetical protein